MPNVDPLLTTTTNTLAYPSTGGGMTLGDMKKQVLNWLREGADDSMLEDAINDGIASLWNSIMLVSISNMIGGPINLSIAAADERMQIVTLADPVAAVVAAGVGGGALAARTVFIAYTYVTDSGTETKISPTFQLIIGAPNFLAQVTAPVFQLGAIGWNCYMGSSLDALGKQNDDPLPFKFGLVAALFTEDVNGAIDAPAKPSPPAANNTGDNVAYIRHMEVQQSDGRFTPWDQADIDSLAMRRAARTVASSSEFQPYAYDLINDNQVEIRPAAGAALTPRMFYVVKPRRLIYDNSKIPFTNVDPTLFLRTFALGLIHLAFHEYDAAQAWEDRSNKERQAIMLVYNKRAYSKNNRVAPLVR